MNRLLLTVMIRHDMDVVTVRHRAREVAALLGFDTRTQTGLATAASEIARNAYLYAGSGKAEFLVCGNQAPHTFVIRIQDHGPGISDLQEIISGRDVTVNGRASGILGAQRLVYNMRIDSNAEQGTTVELVQPLPSGPSLTPSAITRLVDELARQQPRSAVEEVQRQNQELLQTLAELRRRQEELHQLNRELEDTNRGVLALYAELDERAQRLREADAIKSRFLSHMSHELRTPLNSIIALSRLLLDRTDGTLSPDQDIQVNYIRRAAENLSELVNDLLDLAKVESGKVVINVGEFTVYDLFSALRGMMRPLLGERQLELIFEESPDHHLPALHTDEGKVSQILRNLLSNALKFTEEGTVRVAAEFDSSRDVVAFTVTDTGIGIAPENQELIFEEFSQVENPIQKRVRGTGLGLPVSRKLAELLGGSLTVVSEINKGSSFIVVVPRVYRASSDEPLFADGAAAVDGRKPTKILLVDDNEADRYVFRNVLSGTGNIILEALNGAEALVRASQEQPDVIFLDLVMPGLNGFQILEELKSQPATASIPVVILTSRYLDDWERNYLTRQTAGILSKGSTSRDLLISQIDAAIWGSKGRQE